MRVLGRRDVSQGVLSPIFDSLGTFLSQRALVRRYSHQRPFG